MPTIIVGFIFYPVLGEEEIGSPPCRIYLVLKEGGGCSEVLHSEELMYVVASVVNVLNATGAQHLPATVFTVSG
eukprot:scaffold26329_cov47-Attheya_sp.AAC.1